MTTTEQNCLPDPAGVKVTLQYLREHGFKIDAPPALAGYKQHQSFRTKVTRALLIILCEACAEHKRNQQLTR